MSMKFLTNVDLNKNQLLNAVLQNLAADPAVATSKDGQMYYNTTDKVIKVFNGTTNAWQSVSADAVLSVKAATAEKVINVDNTDAHNPVLSMNISATQGTGVTVSQETDGLKVNVQDGSTTVKGIVQLDSTPSATEEAKAATPKGANITLTKEATATTGSVHTYTVAQGGTALTTKIELVQGSTTAAGLVKLDDTPSATENTTAATPKGANVTVTKLGTATAGYLATYEIAQGGVAIATKIDIPKDFFIKEGKVVTATDYAIATAYNKCDVILYNSKRYVVTAAIAAGDNTKFEDVHTKEVSGTFSAGDKILVFILNTKEGTEEDEFVVLPVNDLVQTYTAGNGIDINSSNEISVNAGDGLALNTTAKTVEASVADGLKIDATSKKIVIDNAITAQSTQAVYPVTLTAQGLVASYGSALKTAKKSTATLGTAETSKKIALTASQELLDCFVLDADGNKVFTDIKVESTGVTFSVPSATGENLTCYVVYQDTAAQ